MMTTELQEAPLRTALARPRPEPAILIWALAAAAQALPWAVPSWSWTAWLAWVPWFILLGRPRKPPLRASWLLGLAVSLAALRWMASEFIVLYLATALLLSLHWLLFAWVLGRLDRLRLPFFLSAPLAWIGLEMLRSRFFPWILAGQLLAGELTLIQIADLTAIYGASFLVIAANAALAGLWRLRPERTPAARRAVFAGLLGAACLVLGAWTYGRHRLATLPSRPGPVVVAVQGNVTLAEWRTVPWRRILERYRGITLAVCRGEGKKGPDLVCWPESVVPRSVDRDTGAYLAVSAVAKEAETAILLGGLRKAGDRRHNTAYLFGREGALAGAYDKTRLVPFGEYVPGGAGFGPWTKFSRWLSGCTRFITGAGESNFPMVLQAAGGSWRLGPLICYEEIFPDLSRRCAREGADFMVVLSNEARFQASEVWQREALARFRCVETRRGMIRASNRGISEIIAPTGGILARTGIPAGAPGCAVGRMPLCREETFHTRHGDLFGWACLGLTVLLLGISAAPPFTFRGRCGSIPAPCSADPS